MKLSADLAVVKQSFLICTIGNESEEELELQQLLQLCLHVTDLISGG